MGPQKTFVELIIFWLNKKKKTATIYQQLATRQTLCIPQFSWSQAPHKVGIMMGNVPILGIRTLRLSGDKAPVRGDPTRTQKT